MRCLKCFKEIPDDSKFCMYCGEDTAIEKEIRCKHCGNVVHEGSLFCSNCGSKINEDSKNEVINTNKVSVLRYLKGTVNIIMGILLLLVFIIPLGKFSFRGLGIVGGYDEKLEISYDFTKSITGLKYFFEDNTMQDFFDYVEEEAVNIEDKYSFDFKDEKDQKKALEILGRKINPLYLYSINEYKQITTLQQISFVILIIAQILLLFIIPFLIIFGIILLTKKDDKINKSNKTVQKASIVLFGMVLITNGIFLSTSNYMFNSNIMILAVAIGGLVLLYKIIELILTKKFVLRNLIKSSIMVLGVLVIYFSLLNTGIKYQYKYTVKGNSKTEFEVTETARSFAGVLDKTLFENELELNKDLLIENFFGILESNITRKNKTELTKLLGNNLWTAVEETGSEMEILITLTTIISIATFIVLSTVLLMVLIRFVYQAENKSLFLTSLQILSLILVIAQIVLLVITSLTMNQYFGFFGLDKGARTVYTSVSIAQYFGLVLTIALLVFNIVFKEKSKNS